MRGARGGDSEADLSAGSGAWGLSEGRAARPTIRAIRENESRLTGAPQVTGRRFVPVLVATEGFPVNPMTTAAIEREIAYRHLLESGLVWRLQIIDQEELDMIENVVETGQAGFLELLDGHERARCADGPQVLAAVGPLDVGTPRRLERAFRKSWRPALRALGKEGR